MLIAQKANASTPVFQTWCVARPFRQNSISPMPSMP